jgi:hypothetical protein
VAITFSAGGTAVNSTTAALAYSTAAWTPAANSVVLVFVGSRGDNTDPSSVTQSGVTLTQLARRDSSADTSLFIYGGIMGASPTNTAATATWGVNRTGCHVHAVAASGCDISSGSMTVSAAGPIIQAPQSGTAAATSLTLTFSAASHADNRQAGCCLHRANEVKNSPSANWTVLSDAGFNSPTSGMESAYNATTTFETTPQWTWTTSAIGGAMGVELKAALPSFPLLKSVYQSTLLRM